MAKLSGGADIRNTSAACGIGRLGFGEKGRLMFILLAVNHGFLPEVCQAKVNKKLFPGPWQFHIGAAFQTDDRDSSFCSAASRFLAFEQN